jgi:hypothetical protein
MSHVFIEGGSAGEALFCVRVSVTSYSFHSPVSPSLLLLRAELCHHIVIGLYWQGLPKRTLAFDRQKCAPGHKLSKEHLTVATEACSNWKNQKNLDCSRVPKQPAFLSIITTRKEHGCVGRFLKIGSTSILFQKFGLS